MRLHKELDAQPQPTGSHIVHLLADAIPQIQPQVFAFAAGELQPEVVHLNDAQLPANLDRYKCRVRTTADNEDGVARATRGAGGLNPVHVGCDLARISVPPGRQGFHLGSHFRW